MNNNKLSKVNKVLNNYYKEEVIYSNEIPKWKKANFKKYEKLIINSMNQTAGGTKPKIVGQMSQLVPKFKKYCIDNNIEINSKNWKKWYEEIQPNGYEKSKKKIVSMCENFKKVTNEIDEKSIDKWLNNFLYVENIEGLLIQDEIMNFIKFKFPNKIVRAASSKEESKNIDILIDEKKYQVKPLTQKVGTSFNQKWGDEEPIWYKKAIKNKEKVYKFYLPNNLYQK